MKEKIMNIKNVLKIILMIFIIFSMIKSCSKAYNIDDIYEYALQIKSMENVNTYIMRSVNRIIDNYDKLKLIPELQNCVTIEVGGAVYSSSGTSIYYWNSPYKINFDNNQNLSGIPGNGKAVGISSSNVITVGTSANNNWNNARDTCFGLVDLSLNTDDEIARFNWSNWYLNNKFVEPSKLNFIPTTNETVTLPNNEIAFLYKSTNEPTQAFKNMGYIENYENFENVQIPSIFIQDYKNPNNVNSFTLEKENYYLSKNGTLWINNLYLYENYAYEIPIWTDTESKIFYLYIANPNYESGDNLPWGNGDYTVQNIVNGIVGQEPSGDNPGSGILGGITTFFNGIYDKMFKVESGDIERFINQTIEDNNIEQLGILSGDKEILNILNGTPQDFIISWNSAEYMGKQIIPSGDINITERIRQNETFTRLLHWVHILMGYSIITILITEWWFTVLKMLGVSTSIYEQNEEEIERINDIHEEKIYQTEVLTPRGIKRYTTKRKRIN